MMEPIELEYIEMPDGLLYPNIAEPESFPIGKYGRMKAEFMAKHQRLMESLLIFKCKREEYLAMINKEAMEMEDRMVEQMLEKDPGPSQSEDWKGWTDHRAGLRKAAEEIIWTTYVMPNKVNERADFDAIRYEWPETDEEDETEE